MKKILFICLALQMTNIAIAQKVKKMIVKNDYPKFEETFFVLKSNKSIKHGQYVKKIRGLIMKKGMFNNGVKTGVWEYYDMKGNIVQRVDSQSNILIFNKSTPKGQDNQIRKKDESLLALGGIEWIYQQIITIIKYPMEAKRKGIQGKVYVKLLFDDKGELSDLNVVKGIDKLLDEEAIRIFKKVDFDILPGLDSSGNPIRSEMVMPITFKLG